MNKDPGTTAGAMWQSRRELEQGWSEAGEALLEARVFQTGLPPPLNPIHRQEPVLVASFVSLAHAMVILEEETSIKKIPLLHCLWTSLRGLFLIDN